MNLSKWVTLLLAVGTMALAPAVQAQTWCTTTFPNALFCDDFDGYPDGAAFARAWVDRGPCASGLGLDTDFYSSPPYAGKMNGQEGGDLGFSTNAITDVIRDAFGPTCTSSEVIGTDLNPLVLEFVMNGQTPSKGQYDNSALAMVSGMAYAPTDWAYSDWCTTCGSPKPRFPIICQQEQPAALCPPISTAPPVPAIAAGFLAYLDSNPCHCGESWNSPINEHLSFFDGKKWYKLRQGLFPGNGDFRLRRLENRIKVTVTSSKLKVELTTPDTGEYSWCEIAGGYSGPFNALETGFHEPCQLKTGDWVCRGDPGCRDAVGVPGGAVPRYDNIVVHGGICNTAPGACCFADTSCVETRFAGDCLTLGGQPGEPGSTCAETACCPPFRPDHDMDGDVDLDDFGWFQTCLSGDYVTPPSVPCKCAILDHDTDVDTVDLDIFLGCLHGPGIPVNPNCAP